MIRRATLEILQDGEKIFGSPTQGKYFVQEFENEQPKGGAFFTTIEEAEKHMMEYETGGDDNNPQFLAEDRFDGLADEDEEPNPYHGTYSED